MRMGQGQNCDDSFVIQSVLGTSGWKYSIISKLRAEFFDSLMALCRRGFRYRPLLLHYQDERLRPSLGYTNGRTLLMECKAKNKFIIIDSHLLIKEMVLVFFGLSVDSSQSSR